MRQTLTFILLLIFFTTFGQTKTDSTNLKLTSKFAGVYSYGNDPEKERIGQITLFPETDSTLLFYIDLNKGAPSYSMGALYGRLKIQNNTGIFYRKSNYTEDGCKWLFTFSKNKLTIKTLDGQYSCDFGHGVFGDGVFNKEKTSSPDHFINQEGKTFYFKQTKPEDYEQ